MLRKLPVTLQGSILHSGALHVLPTHGVRESVYRHVREQCEGLCELRCEGEECLLLPEMLWPMCASDFETLVCPTCGAAMVLVWRVESPMDDAGSTPVVVGSTDALGSSFQESYGVWLRMVGRAAVGNMVYEAGASVTRWSSEFASDLFEIESGNA